MTGGKMVASGHPGTGERKVIAVSRLLVEVAEGAEYIDASFETASWWDRLVLTPGTYEMEPVTIEWQPVPDGDRPYYALVRVPATVVEEFRVSRLLHHSIAEHREVSVPRTKTFHTFWYNVERVLAGQMDPRCLLHVEGLTVRVVEEVTP